VDDSKALPPERRRELAQRIRAEAISFAVAAEDARTIDRTNILEATRMAMARALGGLAPRPDCAVVDAVALRGLPFPCLGLVKGDSLCYAVACASILAKVERDAMMVELDAAYPHYGFAHHKGYAAPEHLEALHKFGPSTAHRLTFRAVVPREGEAMH
jgi:ribonuclease HII